MAHLEQLSTGPTSHRRHQSQVVIHRSAQDVSLRQQVSLSPNAVDTSSRPMLTSTIGSRPDLYSLWFSTHRTGRIGQIGACLRKELDRAVYR